MRAKYLRTRDVVGTDEIELKLVFGLLYHVGLHNSGRVNITDPWADDGTGVEMCRHAMTECQF